jgi:tRNA(Ile)-lysidine synthase
LLKQFIAFVNKEHLFTTGDGLLLAVSGGVDSVVLCELCFQAGYDFVIAHGNFQLRGVESERDEQFVLGLGKKYGKQVLVKRFDTLAYAEQQKVSVQVAARELRYAWFESVVGNRQPAIGSDAPIHNSPLTTCIVTAHHLDDNVETLLMKFFKGTGIAGLHGILPKQGKLVRPLLFAKKEELLQFAQQHQLPWVEDSSNAQDKYARNYLRHQVIPSLQQLYPEVVTNLADNIARFREAEVLYHQAVDLHRKKLLEYKGEEVHIPVLKLKKVEPLYTLVYEIAKAYGFSPGQVPDIVRLLDSESGRYVGSASHRIIRNRNWLIIAPVAAEVARHILIEENDTSVAFAGGHLQVNKLAKAEWQLSVAGAIAGIDYKQVHFPLLLRPWKAGDYFYPLGMQKKKKLARFLTDQKLSKTDKEQVWVLESQKRIIWVVGMRIDDRFKITDATANVLQVELKPL